MESEVYLLLFLIGVNLFGNIRTQSLTLEVENTSKIWPESISGTSYTISMHEEIATPYTIAYFDYAGTTAPTFNVIFPAQGGAAALGLSIANLGFNRYALQITTRQDYESNFFATTTDPQYYFSVSAGNTVTVTLNLVNINDNTPVLEIPSSCNIEENSLDISDCIYTISDLDGYMKDMTWTLSNDGDYYFDFYEENPPSDNRITARTLILQPKNQLDYENTTLHIMDWIVMDVPFAADDEANPGTARMVVFVIDMPDMPPMWTSIFASETFDELESRSFTIEARDGDVGIDDDIIYSKSNDYNDLISIGEISGEIAVEPIDRDELNQDIFQFMVFACEVISGDCINQTIVFLVNDINNKFPNITVAGNTTFDIPENYYDDLDIDMFAHDKDTGQNAMYTVQLFADNGQTDAFTVAPSSGYQNTTLYMYITNYRLLDYDRSEIWRNFELRLTTVDMADPFNPDTVIFTIILNNVNDEIPYFVKEDEETGEPIPVYEYQTSINETVPMNTDVVIVLARDDDIDDYVRYSILGSYINNILTIDDVSGLIKTRINGSFDYETQTEVILQVQATDTLRDIYGTPFNSAVAQITITVLDVNDETPRITVGSERVELVENVEDGHVFVNNTVAFLIGTDDDNGANLTFTIDWENSYATKFGRRKTDDEFRKYKECVKIQTETYEATGNGQAVIGLLETAEVVKNNTPDYEFFDILYLNVVVTDLHQEVNDNSTSVIVPIYILDINDVAPVFINSTITSSKTVNEESLEGTTIGIIIATDEDSDTIFYSLYSTDYYANTVNISDVGEIYVAGRIDADEPELYEMVFTVIASDGELYAEAEITITVNDINDNAPIFQTPLEGDDFLVFEEEEEGYSIALLNATDIDRDPDNYIVNYRFSSSIDSQLQNYFQIRDSVLIVSYANELNKLDRDNGVPGIVNTIRITAFDSNVNDVRSNETSFTITLLDINNKTPRITTTSLTASENYTPNQVIGQLQAEDDDEAGTNNTQVGFTYLGVTAVNGKEPVQDMFAINNIDINARTANLYATVDLAGYYGTYEVQIEAYDHGINPGPLRDNYTITVEIELYNFENPSFIFPSDGQLILLSKGQSPDSTLYWYNGVTLTDIRATDNQGDKYEQMDFTLSNNEDFTWSRTGGRTCRLEVLRADLEGSYELTITAQAVSASPPRSTPVRVNVQFVDITADPIFDVHTETITFVENQTEVQTEGFVNAYFADIPPEVPGDEYIVFYIISSDNPGNFVIEDNTINSLSTSIVLDREERDTYTLLIQCSRTDVGIAIPLPASSLTLTIEIQDINDNPPNFVSRVYNAGIMSTWDVGTVVLTVVAIDLDDNDPLTYSMGSYQNTPTNINNERPLELTTVDQTGVITMLSVIPENADGFFLFTVTVFDGEWYDTCTVKIYVVTETHRVEFVFQNDYNTVFATADWIKLVLQNIFEYDCVIEAIVQNTDGNGDIVENETIVRVHFIDSVENVAIDKSEIESMANDITLLTRLQSEFDVYSLILIRVLDTRSTTQNLEQVLKAWLIAISVILGVLLIVLLVTFILKTRSLTQRLNKLSVIRYGSQDSVFNRKAAPTTNKHTIEGSNPAYNEEKITKDYDDTASIGSGDSDLVGVENNPEFEPKEKIKY